MSDADGQRELGPSQTRGKRRERPLFEDQTAQLDSLEPPGRLDTRSRQSEHEQSCVRQRHRQARHSLRYPLRASSPAPTRPWERMEMRTPRIIAATVRSVVNLLTLLRTLKSALMTSWNH